MAYGLVEEISEDKKLAEDAGKGQFEKIKQGLLTLSDPAARITQNWGRKWKNSEAGLQRR